MLHGRASVAPVPKGPSKSYLGRLVWIKIGGHSLTPRASFPLQAAPSAAARVTAGSTALATMVRNGNDPSEPRGCAEQP